ncbi:cyclin-dependent kinase 5 activator 1-like [Spea bombifrons]|uniref:cyclin-dependent kinase 5 activator 1-like n=1 Tax=Spea bombifrons TaxID=233779 RepID=UPI00234BFBB2|nr:cyclin-dependent kinase 5 activator 1-like [Spea bombifrons]
MASQEKKTGKSLKRRSSVSTSDPPLKRFLARVLNKQPEDNEPTSSGQNTVPDPNNLPSQRDLEPLDTIKVLHWFGRFICGRCPMIPSLSPMDPVRWIVNVDRALYLQGWQAEPFLTPATVTFLYLVCREAISSCLVSKQELKAALMACLYVSYSYTGARTSYPFGLFIAGSVKEAFWNRCLAVAITMSGEMLRIYNDPAYFAETFADLKAEGDWERS